MPDSIIKITTLNVRGLAAKEKRVDLFAKLKEDKNDIILLQDVHWDQETLIMAKNELGCKIFSSTFTTQSRGTAILINNTFEFTIGEIKKDQGGNYTLVEIKLLNDITIVLGAIYGPNQDNPDFYNGLNDEIRNFGNPNIILGGDWNSTRNFKLDNKNYAKHNNPTSYTAITEICQHHNLIDAWRVNNPNKKQYTWIQGISNKQARLDYFLITEELLSITGDHVIGCKYRSDHAPVRIKIILNDQERGPGIWKFNNSLLLDDDFMKLIKKEIANFKLIYAATPYNPDFIRPLSHNFDLMIDPSLFWETLLVTLRGTIIKYSGKKKRSANRDKNQLNKRIETLDAKINSGNGNLEDFRQLTKLNSTLIRKVELEGALIRSRAEWLDHGEQPSKYFLNLENKNRVNKNISEIKTNDNTIINDQHKILVELKNFYQDLYKDQQETETTQYNPDIIPNRITDEDREKLEAPITKAELDIALKKMKNNISPGLDGYSPDPAGTVRTMYVHCTYSWFNVRTMYVQCTYIVRTMPAG